MGAWGGRRKRKNHRKQGLAMEGRSSRKIYKSFLEWKGSPTGGNKSRNLKKAGEIRGGTTMGKSNTVELRVLKARRKNKEKLDGTSQKKWLRQRELRPESWQKFHQRSGKGTVEGRCAETSRTENLLGRPRGPSKHRAGE